MHQAGTGRPVGHSGQKENAFGKLVAISFTRVSKRCREISGHEGRGQNMQSVYNCQIDEK